MTNEQTIHVRLPDATYEALVQKQKEIGEDIPMSIIVRRLLDQALGLSRKPSKTDRRPFELPKPRKPALRT